MGHTTLVTPGNALYKNHYLMSYIHLHVHTKNIAKLCTNLRKVTSHSSLDSETQAVSEKFTTILRYFSPCHKGYNSSGY